MALDSQFWVRCEITFPNGFKKTCQTLFTLYLNFSFYLVISRDSLFAANPVFTLSNFFSITISELLKNVETAITSICIATRFVLIHNLWFDKTCCCIYYVVYICFFHPKSTQVNLTRTLFTIFT